MKEPVVMIVDDEPDVRDAISLLLKSVNHQVDVFESAQDYWSRFDPEQPGCLILNQSCPRCKNAGHEWHRTAGTAKSTRLSPSHHYDFGTWRTDLGR